MASPLPPDEPDDRLAEGPAAHGVEGHGGGGGAAPEGVAGGGAEGRARPAVQLGFAGPLFACLRRGNASTNTNFQWKLRFLRRVYC